MALENSLRFLASSRRSLRLGFGFGARDGGKKRYCLLFCNRRVQIYPGPQHRRIGLVDKQ